MTSQDIKPTLESIEPGNELVELDEGQPTDAELNKNSQELRTLLGQISWISNPNNRGNKDENSAKLLEYKKEVEKLLVDFDYEKISKYSSPFFMVGKNIDTTPESIIELFLNNNALKIDYTSLFAGIFYSLEKIELVIKYLEKYNKLNEIDEKRFGDILSYNFYKNANNAYNSYNSYSYSPYAYGSNTNNDNKEKISALLLEKCPFDNLKFVFKLYNFIYLDRNAQYNQTYIPRQSFAPLDKKNEDTRIEYIKLKKDLYANLLEYVDLKLEDGIDPNYRFGNFNRHIFYEFAKSFSETEENIEFIEKLFKTFNKYNFDPNIVDETYKNDLFQNLCFYQKYKFLIKFIDIFGERIDYEHKNNKGSNLLGSFLKSIKNDYYVNQNPNNLNPKEKEKQNLVRDILFTMFKRVDFEARGGKKGKGKKFIDHIKTRAQKGSIFFQSLYDEIMIENAISKKVDMTELPARSKNKI